MFKQVRKKIYSSDPYKELQFLELDEQGWSSTGSSFEECIKIVKPELIIEVGTWKGASAINMAKFALDCGIPRKNLEIVCIDTFLGSQEMYTMLRLFDEQTTGIKNTKNGRPLIYEQFLSNVAHNQLQDIITPFPIDSYNAGMCLKHWGIKADMIYIDAGHDYDLVLNDFKIYKDILRDGGYMLIDDWNYDQILKAAKDVFGDTTVEFHQKGLWIK